jgi:hypothetical protein
MKGPASEQNLRVKLEKVTLTSRLELAEPSSVAHQRNSAGAQTDPTAEGLGKFALH